MSRRNLQRRPTTRSGSSSRSSPPRKRAAEAASALSTVRQSRGSIWVYSEPGKGTTFKVYFPRANESDAPAIVPPADAEIPVAEVAGVHSVRVGSTTRSTAVKRVLQIAETFAVGVGALALYLAVERFVTTPAVATRTILDDGIPFVPGFVVVYASLYVVAPALAFGLSRDRFAAAVRRAAVLLAIDLVIFTLFPTSVDRPALDHVDSVFAAPLELLYAVDSPPRNAAPSGHVGLAIILGWAASEQRGAWSRIALWAWVVLVIVSTVLVSQHHVVDVITGAAMALIVLGGFALIERYRRGTAST